MQARVREDLTIVFGVKELSIEGLHVVPSDLKIPLAATKAPLGTEINIEPFGDFNLFDALAKTNNIILLRSFVSRSNAHNNVIDLHRQLAILDKDYYVITCCYDLTNIMI